MKRYMNLISVVQTKEISSPFKMLKKPVCLCEVSNYLWP